MARDSAGQKSGPSAGHWDRSLHREVPEGGTDTKPMWVRNPPFPLNSVLDFGNIWQRCHRTVSIKRPCAVVESA
jgi:hypothetical protein